MRRKIYFQQTWGFLRRQSLISWGHDPDFKSYFPVMYLDPCQTSKKELFEKIVNGFQLLIIFTKCYILDVGQGSEYSSNLYMQKKDEKCPPPPYQFSPVTSLNVRISPQNFLTFAFHSFATLLLDFKAIRSTSSNFLGLNLDHPSKKLVFVIKSL